jgi:hypothetical protein
MASPRPTFRFTPTKPAPAVRAAADDARARSRDSENNAAWTPDELKRSFEAFQASPALLLDSDRKLSPSKQASWSPRVLSSAPLFPDSPDLDDVSFHHKATNHATLMPMTPNTGWTSAATAAPAAAFVLGYRRQHQPQLDHLTNSVSSTLHHSSSCPCFLPIDIDNEEYDLPPSLAPSGGSSPDLFLWGRRREDESPQLEEEEEDCRLQQQNPRTPTKKPLPILPKKKKNSSSSKLSWFGD